VEFRLEQRFRAPLEEVEAALVDPALLVELSNLPRLGGPEILARSDDGDTVTMSVRYRFVGHLSAAVTAVVDPGRLTWVERSTLDRGTHRTAFRIEPDHYADRLACEGVARLEADGDGTRRTVEGDIRVRFPLVGGKVERAIVSGLEDHADAEAAIVEAWLDRK
jgi:hypothetical protein